MRTVFQISGPRSRPIRRSSCVMSYPISISMAQAGWRIVNSFFGCLSSGGAKSRRSGDELW
jgi:hypothetical protein